jgi:hypothetical protein
MFGFAEGSDASFAYSDDSFEVSDTSVSTILTPRGLDDDRPQSTALPPPCATAAAAASLSAPAAEEGTDVIKAMLLAQQAPRNAGGRELAPETEAEPVLVPEPEPKLEPKLGRPEPERDSGPGLGPAATAVAPPQALRPATDSDQLPPARVLRGSNHDGGSAASVSPASASTQPLRAGSADSPRTENNVTQKAQRQRAQRQRDKNARLARGQRAYERRRIELRCMRAYQREASTAAYFLRRARRQQPAARLHPQGQGQGQGRGGAGVRPGQQPAVAAGEVGTARVERQGVVPRVEGSVESAAATTLSRRQPTTRELTRSSYVLRAQQARLREEASDFVRPAAPRSAAEPPLPFVWRDNGDVTIEAEGVVAMSPDIFAQRLAGCVHVLARVVTARNNPLAAAGGSSAARPLSSTKHMWLKLPSRLSGFVAPAVRQGFDFYSAAPGGGSDGYVLLSKPLLLSAAHRRTPGSSSSSSQLVVVTSRGGLAVVDESEPQGLEEAEVVALVRAVSASPAEQIQQIADAERSLLQRQKQSPPLKVAGAEEEFPVSDVETIRQLRARGHTAAADAAQRRLDEASAAAASSKAASPPAGEDCSINSAAVLRTAAAREEEAAQARARVAALEGELASARTEVREQRDAVLEASQAVNSRRQVCPELCVCASP